jgi:hypothetical protein
VGWGAGEAGGSDGEGEREGRRREGGRERGRSRGGEWRVGFGSGGRGCCCWPVGIGVVGGGA